MDYLVSCYMAKNEKECCSESKMTETKKHANVKLYKSKLLFLVQFSRRSFNSTTELVQNLSRLSSGQDEVVSMADKEGYD